MRRVLFFGLMIFLGGLVQARTNNGPDLVGIRLGDHGGTTRLVLDFAVDAPPFETRFSEDGRVLVLSFAARSTVKPGSLPHAGLVTSARMMPQEMPKEMPQEIPQEIPKEIPRDDQIALEITLVQPGRIAAQGALPPNATYRHHRIYLDLVAGPPLPSPPPSSPPAMVRAVESPEAPPDDHTEPSHEAHAVSHGEMHPNTHLEHAEEEEPLAHVKLGAAGDRSFKGGTVSGGPSASIQTGIFGDALEIEGSGTALFDRGHPTWKTGLLLKKPIELSPHFEIELGIGPSWIRKTTGDHPEDSLGGETVGELVYWGTEEKRFGVYLEGNYGRDFGKGHESGTGVGAGLLIAVP